MTDHSVERERSNRLHNEWRIWARFANSVDIDYLERFIKEAGGDPRYRLGPARRVDRYGRPYPEGCLVYRVKHPSGPLGAINTFCITEPDGRIRTILDANSHEEINFKARQRAFRRLPYADQLRWRLDAGLKRNVVNPVDTGIVAYSLLKQIGEAEFSKLAERYTGAGHDLMTYIWIGRRLVALGSRVYHRIGAIATADLVELLKQPDADIVERIGSIRLRRIHIK